MPCAFLRSVRPNYITTYVHLYFLLHVVLYSLIGFHSSHRRAHAVACLSGDVLPLAARI